MGRYEGENACGSASQCHVHTLSNKFDAPVVQPCRTDLATPRPLLLLLGSESACASTERATPGGTGREVAESAGWRSDPACASGHAPVIHEHFSDDAPRLRGFDGVCVREAGRDDQGFP